MLLSDGLYQSTGFIYLWSRTGHTPASSLSHGFPHFSWIHGVCVAWAASSFDFISWHFCWIPKVIHSTKQSMTNRFDVRGFWKFIVLVVKELQLLCVTVCSDVCDQQRAAQHQSERSSHMTWRVKWRSGGSFFTPSGRSRRSGISMWDIFVLLTLHLIHTMKTHLWAPVSCRDTSVCVGPLMAGYVFNALDSL